ncbi:alpha/beta hydrolase [Deltaproteobacteria bacterium PRO3]|nr:alpha/beta hydrolase [Deltaproteobacteria bacterium PRO3]
MKRLSHWFCFGLSLVLLSACPKPKEGAQTLTLPDGGKIVYETKGSGDATLLFIHCWSCNRRYWDSAMAELSKNYRVVALDLRGHGESDRGRKDLKVADLARDVDALIKQLKLNNVVLVGSSMGGSISLAAAKDNPGTVVGVVCVDTLQNVEMKTPEDLREGFIKSLEQDFRAGLAKFMPMVFAKDADPKLIAWAVEQASKTDPQAAVSLIKDLFSLDLASWMSAVKVPIRCLNSDSSPPLGLKTSVEVNRKYADFDVVELQGSGHLPQLERPEEFNRKLRETVEGLVKK